MRHQSGFTLLELMIVIALIVIILAITIPSMTQAKINANEVSAVGSVRAIGQAEVSYQAAYGGYAESLANLGGAEPCAKSASTACLLDQSLAGGVKSGYNFAAVGSNAVNGMSTSYFVGAAPAVFERTGIWPADAETSRDDRSRDHRGPRAPRPRSGRARLDPKRTVQVGLNGPLASFAQDNFSRDIGYRMMPLLEIHARGIDATIEEIRQVVGFGPTFISFDLDVLTLSDAPAVANPFIPGGADPL